MDVFVLIQYRLLLFHSCSVVCTGRCECRSDVTCFQPVLIVCWLLKFALCIYTMAYNAENPSIKELVHRATTDLLIGPDWEKNLQICDMVTDSVYSPSPGQSVVNGISLLSNHFLL